MTSKPSTPTGLTALFVCLLVLGVLSARPAPSAVSAVPGDPLTGSGEIARTVMTREHLVDGHDFGSPVNEMIFRRRPKGAHPEHTFVGRLELLGEATRGDLEVIQDAFDLRGARTAHLPEFDFEFVQHGSHLIPVRRGLIITEHPQWNYFLEPGRVWKENADAGLSRASFPFALVQKNQACTFNGVMSFLFDDASISHVWYQITQETCYYFKGNFWGMLEAIYHSGSVAGAERIRRRYVREVREKFPRAPLERLAEDYPGVDVYQFGLQVDRRHMTTFGVVMDGVVYTAPCRTRFGESAYCEQMRFPSYSTAKTAYVGVTLMRLAQKYGAWVPELRIADYVEETADAAGDWSAVTLGHALDMTTGNYVDPRTYEDENSHINAFYDARTYAEKMWQALRAPHQDAPGTRWVYRSTDTFVAGRTMARFLSFEEGQNLDLFKWMVREVYRPLKTGPGFHTTLRTADNNWRGLPFTYMGLFWTHDDVAKVVTFLNVDRGAIDGEQLLHPELFAAAMQETPASLGIDTGTTLGHYRYGFYAQPWRSGAAVEVHGPFQVQYMLGYGGIIIVMMPNGSAYYYFSDNAEYAFSAAVEESMLHLRSSE